MAKRYSDTPSLEVAALAALLTEKSIHELMNMRAVAVASQDTLVYLATTYAINRANVARGL